ncbi:hypothetical protein [Streptomyces sp. NPDC006640]|uniref:hypothetical protein n=1 Tax=unclassified Streptomyces TaxID=2593676 RepID=UPI0036C086E2
MSKERLTVCVPGCAQKDVSRAIDAAMAPYDYNRDEGVGVPVVETWWDYWKVDGRGCEFSVAQGYEADPRLIRGTETLNGQPRNVPPSLCDGGPRTLLDLEGPRARAAADERRAFDAWQTFSSAYPPAYPADHFWARHFADPEGYPQAQVIEDYRTQPVIAALSDQPELNDLIGGDPVARHAYGLDTLIRDATDGVLATQALLTLDGQWLTVSSAEQKRYFNDYLDGLAGDVLVVRVMYHG